VLDLYRPRSAWEIVRCSLATYRRYPALFLILALGVVAPFDLAVLAVTGHGPLARFSSGSFIPLYDILTFSLLGPLISALHVHAVTLIEQGRHPRLSEVGLRGVRALPDVAAAEIVANIGIYLGLAALVVPGVLLSLMFAVAAQAAAVEREGWLFALRSSRRLARERWGHIFALQYLVVGLFSAAVLVGARALPLGGSSGAPSVAVGIAVRTAVWSLTALTSALLYFDLRARLAAPASKAPREYPHLRDLD
jgi:hypothetical protein